MKLGKKGKFLQYLANFLENPQIITTVNKQYSASAPVENGIVQGSIISLTLFNIATHDTADDAYLDTHHIIYSPMTPLSSCQIQMPRRSTFIYNKLLMK